MKQNLIVAYFGSRTLGWSHNGEKAIFYGDKEWEDIAKRAAKNKEFISLYGGEISGVADVENPKNIKGVFLALAALPKERIRISEIPDGYLDEWGLEIEELASTADVQVEVSTDFTREEFLRSLIPQY